MADKNKVFTSNPVPIVKREELEDSFINDETGVVELEKISFYLKFQEELLNDSKRYEIIEQKKEKSRKIQENIERRDEEYKEYFSKQECIKNQTIESDSIESSRGLIDTLESETVKMQAELENLESLKRKITLVNEQINQNVTALNEKKNLAGIRLQDFEMLRESYNDYCDAKEEKIRLDKKNEDIDNKLNIITEKLNNLIEDIKADEKTEMKKKQELLGLQERYEYFEKFSGKSENVDKASYTLLDEEERISKEAAYNALLNDYSNEVKLLTEQYNSANRRFLKSKQELAELLAKYRIKKTDIEKTRYDKDDKAELDERISANNMELQLYDEKLNKVNTQITKKESDIEHAYKDMYRIAEKKEPISKDKISDTNFKDRIIIIQNEIRDTRLDLDGVTSLCRGYEANISALAEYSDLKVEETDEHIKKEDIFGKSVKEIDKFRGMMIRDYRELIENERKQSNVITRLLNEMARKNIFKDEFFQKPIEVLLSLTDNAVNFMKQLDILVSSYESMIEKLEVDVAIVEKERVRIVELLEEYVRDVHEELGKIDGNSTIKVHGERKKMLKITLPEWYENEEIYHLKIQDILEEVTAKTIKALEENKNPDDITGLYINTKYLYDTVAGTGNVRIKLYKIEEQKGREISWSDVAKKIQVVRDFVGIYSSVKSALLYEKRCVRCIYQL